MEAFTEASAEVTSVDEAPVEVTFVEVSTEAFTEASVEVTSVEASTTRFRGRMEAPWKRSLASTKNVDSAGGPKHGYKKKSLFLQRTRYASISEPLVSCQSEMPSITRVESRTATPHRGVLITKNSTHENAQPRGSSRPSDKEPSSRSNVRAPQ